MKRAKHILPALLLLAANDYLMPLSINDSDSAMIILLLLMPGLTLAVCFACGCGRFSWLFPFLVTIHSQPKPVKWKTKEIVFCLKANQRLSDRYDLSGCLMSYFL